ncbi:putative quinol monooxygenase [Mesorhizobium ventifaucium]|uniref:ABM domain-containing protein n=1 Tax=Mesorhizobium ventifaucium TaxID=666020 RepID=A0ABN8JU48_9HYPH|nr:antibiotic biosynthesis monooxygenase [Mesorhizobium ventifaucium]CAH2400604.1 exported hypothetical protein [Mesorhizobium ventifaucium]
MNSLKKYALGALVAATAFISSQLAMAQIVLQPSPNSEVALVVNFEVKPGAEAEFEQVFHRSVTCSRLEPGNITFNVPRSSAVSAATSSTTRRCRHDPVRAHDRSRSSGSS